jgi:GNAT superfamily N-acetyltransferase
MTQLDSLTYLRPYDVSDDPFLYDVFATTWQSEVAALPNQKLARHVLRIQHIAQERRFSALHPGQQRFVVLADGGRPAGRLYVHQDCEVTRIVDLTLMPEFRSRGVGTRIVRDLCRLAARDGHTLSLRAGRRNARLSDLYSRLGFKLVAVDDLDNHFEWTDPSSERADADAVPAARREDTGTPDSRLGRGAPLR